MVRGVEAGPSPALRARHATSSRRRRSASAGRGCRQVALDEGDRQEMAGEARKHDGWIYGASTISSRAAGGPTAADRAIAPSRRAAAASRSVAAAVACSRARSARRSNKPG